MRLKLFAILLSLLVVIGFPFLGLGMRASAGAPPPPSSSEPSSREAGTPADYYGNSYQNLYPVAVYKYDNFGTFTVNAATAGGENAFVMCWSGGKWSDAQVKNVQYNPEDLTLRFKVVGAPSICAIFNGG